MWCVCFNGHDGKGSCIPQTHPGTGGEGAEPIRLQHSSRADTHLLLFHVQQSSAKLAAARRICSTPKYLHRCFPPCCCQERNKQLHTCCIARGWGMHVQIWQVGIAPFKSLLEIGALCFSCLLFYFFTVFLQCPY